MKVPDECISPKKVKDLLHRLKKDVQKHEPDMTDEKYISLVEAVSEYPSAATMIASTVVVLQYLITKP